MAAHTNAGGGFVGRAQELQVLRQAWATARAGTTRVVLVEGEPGIGKSRLLREFAVDAQQQGTAVLWGGASDAEGMPPYLPFIEALGNYLRSAHSLLMSGVIRNAPVLTALLPGLADEAGAPVAAIPFPPEQARLRLYEAVADVLAAIAADRGAILVLDDLHWADQASLDMLTYLVGHRATGGLLIAGGYRPRESSEPRRLDRAIAELTRLRAVDLVALGPLSTAEVGALAAVEGAHLAADALQELARRSDGNPFFVEELLRSGHVAAPPTAVNDPLPSLPAGVRVVVQERVGRLPAGVGEVLRTAAVIGRSFSLAVLARVTGVDDVEQLEAVLETAVEANLLQEQGPGSYRFRHDLVRESLYAQVSSVRRQRLHGFAGRALEEVSPDAGARIGAELAFHFARSGDRERAGQYVLAAAQAAERAYAPHAAAEHYRLVLELCQPGDGRLGAVLANLGRVLLLTGDEQEAVATFRRAADWYQAEGDLLQAGENLRLAGQSLWRLERQQEAEEQLQAAVALLAHASSPALVRALVDLASLLGVAMQRQSEALAYAHQAVAAAAALDDPLVAAAAERALGNLLVRGNQLAPGIARLQLALELAVRSGNAAEAAECCAALAVAHYWQGDLAASEQVTLQRVAFAQQSHDPFELRHVYGWLFVLKGLQADFPEAEHWLAKAEAAVAGVTSPEPRAWLTFCKGGFATLYGDAGTALALLDEALTTFRSLGPGVVVWYLGMQAFALARAGQPAAARACLTELDGLLEPLPPGSMAAAEGLTCALQTAILLNADDLVDRYYAPASAFSGQFHDLVVDRLLAEAELRRGEVAQALAHLLAAEGLSRAAGLRFDDAHCLLVRARLPGHSAPARRALEAEAATLLAGLTPSVPAQAIAHPIATVTEATADPGAGLSRREVEVLQLLARGMTNREIAAALIVSEKTVESHVASVYRKAQLPNRAAAVAYALRHGLSEA